MPLRDPQDSVFIWVDALCIDQAAVQERGYEVKQMQKIYNAAEEVVVWLGESTTLSDYAMELVAMTPETLSKEEHRAKHDTLDHSFFRPYWSRVWVVQELAAAEWTRGACTVRCGAGSFTLAQLKDFVRRMFRSPNINHSKALMRAKALLSLSTQHHNQSFFNVLWASSGLQATEDRGRIYGIRGIPPAFYRDNIDVDYTIGFEKLCTKVMMLMITKERSLDVLCSFRRYDSQSASPSWLRDFRKRDPGIISSIYSADNGQRTRENTKIKNNILRAYGVRISRVDNVFLFNKTAREDHWAWVPRTDLMLPSEVKKIATWAQTCLRGDLNRGRVGFWRWQ
jgi:hypothetical protein